MRKIEYLSKYIGNPEVIKVGVYKGVKYIVVMSDCPEVWFRCINIERKEGLKILIDNISNTIGESRWIDRKQHLPDYVPSQLEELTTNIFKGWICIQFDSPNDYITGSINFFISDKEKRSLEYVLEKTCDAIDTMKKFERVYKDYYLDKAYKEIEEWGDHIKEAYEELEQD